MPFRSGFPLIGYVSNAGSGSGTPAVPEPVQNLVLTPGDAQLRVQADAPASANNANLDYYAVTYTPAGGAATTTQQNVSNNSSLLDLTITGLSNGVEVTVSVVAHNSVGSSVAVVDLATPVTDGGGAVGTNWKKARSGATGGGTATCIASSPFDKQLIASETDTAGVRISRDGGKVWVEHQMGLTDQGLWRGPTVRFSRTVPGRLWVMAGSGAGSGPCGVYVCDKTDTARPTPWTKVSGLKGSTALVFNGSNPKTTEPMPGNYPRQWCDIQLDERDANYTYVFVGTSTDGVYRIKVKIGQTPGDASTATIDAAGDQVRIGGTADLYIMNIQLLADEKSPSLGDYNTLYIAPYAIASKNGPKRIMRCDNALAGSPTAAVVAAGPQNVEDFAYANSATGNEILVAVCGDVPEGTGEYFTSVNPRAATPTFTAIGTGGNKPSPNAWPMSCDVSWDATNYRLIIGVYSGVGAASAVTQTYRAVWAKGAAFSTATWTAQTFADDSRVVMNVAGHPFWLEGASTFGHDGQSVVHRVNTAVADFNRVYYAGRTAPLRSDDGGLNLYPMNHPSQAGGPGLGVDPHPDRYGRAYWSTMDYTLVYSTTGFGATTGDDLAQPKFAVQATKSSPEGNARTPFVDPVNGDVFLCGAMINQRGIPDADASISLYRATAAQVAASANGNLGLDDLTDFNLRTGHGTTAINAAMGGLVVRRGGLAANPRVIVLSCRTGVNSGTTYDGGIWYATGDSTPAAADWKQAGTSAYTGSTDGFDNADMVFDPAKNVVYTYERGSGGTVWRVPLLADNTLGTPVSIFKKTVTGVNSRKDVVGWLALDEANSRLYVSHNAGIHYVDNAHNVGATTDQSNGTLSAFTAKFPNEYPSWVSFTQDDGILHCGTVSYTTTGDEVYPRNGATGSRLLHMDKPTATGAAFTWSDGADDVYRGACGCVFARAMHPNGSFVLLAAYGAGVNGGIFRVSA